ncbi:ATP-binding cassette domain-containing protein [Pseudomonas alkylphenolica]|uniref:Multidrug ABC transporter ATPase n=1 Tax=Pseudomonas alkylphenolica TaxID=237609 RepID=A0A077F694_9PSED|nr:AAA family ATPase [Pseudomonas alkylphenolica]AIL60998.1 multidrug ABC transporter ATPase [Pseudomonas alkylphenolica]
MSNLPPVVEAHSLTKRYKDHMALDGVSLSIEPGTVLGLLGRNGAGKSTLIECLLVLDEPAAALDPLARRELLREIVELASEHGSTVVFSTHILSDLEHIASHVALIHQGQLRLYAELDQLKDELRLSLEDLFMELAA